jgi:putative hydrolase of the HAD superfamily
VLFDVAGTLIELTEPVGRTYARIAAQHGGTFDAEVLDDRFRSALRAAPALVFPGLPRDETARRERCWWQGVVDATFGPDVESNDGFDRRACFDAMFELYASAEAWRARPGTRATLTQLRASGLRLGVVSNFDHRLPNLLEALDLNGLLDHVVHPILCGAAKPDPAIFEFALASLALEPHQVVHVGDDPVNDLAAARRVGLHAITAPIDDMSLLPAQIDAIATLDRPEPRGGIAT